MIRRTLLNAVGVAAALVPLALISCSSDTNNGGAGGTGGTGGTGGSAGSGGSSGKAGAAGSGGSTTDAGTSDASSSPDSGGKGGSAGGVSDAGPMLPDGAVPPKGTPLLSGTFTLAGVTHDNYAVYTDDNAGTLNVISLAGGTPTSIGASGDRVAVMGSVVISWSGTSRVSPMTVWTAANGPKMLAMTAYANATGVAVSPDNTKILYFDGLDTARTSGNLFISGTDGTGQKQLASSIALNNTTSCAPALAFGGNAAAAAAFCAATVVPDGGGDAGTTDAGTTVDAGTPTDAAPLPSAMVQSFSGASWAAVTLASNVNPRVAIAPTGTTVLVSAPAGLVAYPVAGGAATTIDAAGGFGSFTNDGLSVIYTTPTMALKRSTVASPSPVTLAASGITGIRARSPDDKWLLGYMTVGSASDQGDLYLASATTPGTPTTLTADVTGGLFGSDGFTTDSSHAIYYPDITSTGVGTFTAVASAGGTPFTLGLNVWIHHAAAGAKVAFNDNYDTNNNTADIRVADTSQSGPPALVVSLADGDFFVSGSLDKVVYTWSYLPGAMMGLWVTPIP